MHPVFRCRRGPLARAFSALFVWTAALLCSPEAGAQYDDEEVGGYAVVIQNRKFHMGHEFTLSAGVLPLDAFYKGLTGTFRYTLHFDEFQAWEIAGGTYSLNIETDLRELLRRFGFRPDAKGLERLEGYLETNYVLKPIYGKLSLFNRTLVYNELFLVAGFATAVYAQQRELVFLPGPGVGAGLRFFLWDWLSLRFDLRHYVFFNGVPVVDANSTIENVLAISGGVSFNFGGGG